MKFPYAHNFRGFTKTIVFAALTLALTGSVWGADETVAPEMQQAAAGTQAMKGDDERRDQGWNHALIACA